MALTLSLWTWTQTLWGIAFPVGIVALSVSLLTWGHEVGPKPAFIGVMVLVSSVVASVATAWWGFHRPDAALLMAIWVILMLACYVAMHSERVLWCLVPSALALSALLAYQGISAALAHNPIRVPGGPMGANPAAGFLAIVGAALLPTRWRWLVLVFLAGMVFTASRSGLMALAVTGVAVLVLQRHSWRALAGIGVAVVVLIAVAWPLVGALYLRNVDSGYTTSQYYTLDLRSRFALPSDAEGHTILPSFVPRGPAGPFIGLHNVPMRMAYEQGLLASVTWIALTVWALWKRPRGTPVWCAFLAFTVVAMVDYYPMMPLVTSAFWWVLLSIRMKGVGASPARY